MAVEQEDDAGGVPEWVVTFGDMMSLLLTFFIMLVSLSEVKKEEQFQAMAESMRRRFGHNNSVVSLLPGKVRPRNSSLDKMATMGRAQRFDTHRGGDKTPAPVGDHPRVRIIRPGSKTAVGTMITFEEGSAELIESIKRDLQREAREIKGKPQKIDIRGHTSRRPAVRAVLARGGHPWRPR